MLSYIHLFPSVFLFLFYEAIPPSLRYIPIFGQKKFVVTRNFFLKNIEQKAVCASTKPPRFSSIGTRQFMSSQIVKIILHNPRIFNGYFCIFMNTAKILQSCVISDHRCTGTSPVITHNSLPDSALLLQVLSGKCHHAPVDKPHCQKT